MAEIDVAALRRNVDIVSACVGPSVGLLAIVKADAYGHGALACGRALERKVWGFGVSLVEEGVELRRGGIETPVVVLGSFYGQSHRDVVAYRLTPVIADELDVERFARAAGELGVERVRLHLKIDTGMSRLGVRPERLDAVLRAIAGAPAVELIGLCTHLGEADAADLGVARAQLERFDECRRRVLDAGLQPTICHVANSAAVARLSGARFDLVRPGLALYGHSPAGEPVYHGLRPAMSLKSRVVALREVPPGTRVSYGGLYVARERTRIATIPIGYADGYSRRMSGQAAVLVGGRRVPVLGAITMDMCMADVTSVPGCQLGDEVVLMGAQGSEQISAEELARWAGTVVWEVFCGVSKRVPRVYVGDRA